jgi:hypothetical protein
MATGSGPGHSLLRRFLEALERDVGRIENVGGRPLVATDLAGEAAAEIRASDGRTAVLRLPLSRERGLWKISRLAS